MKQADELADKWHDIDGSDIRADSGGNNVQMLASFRVVRKKNVIK